MALRLVKRTDLPSGRNRFQGTQPSEPRAHLQKTGILNFSKLATEAFKERKRAMVEYDEQARTLTFTALERLPRGLEDADCFPIHHHAYKGKPSGSTITVKRLLAFLGFESKQPR